METPNQLLRESFGHGWCRNRRNRHRSRNWRRRRGRGWARDLDFATVVNRGDGTRRSRIKTLSGEIVNDLQRVYGVVRLLIRAVGGQRIKGVGDRDDARQKRNLIS